MVVKGTACAIAEDVLKVDADDESMSGEDAPDARSGISWRLSRGQFPRENLGGCDLLAWPMAGAGLVSVRAHSEMSASVFSEGRSSPPDRDTHL